MNIEITGLGKINPPPLARIRKKAQRILKLLNLENKRLSIVLTDEHEIKRLNRCYLKRNRSTDVLAFSMLEGDKIGSLDLLGDVAISLDTAKKASRIYGTGFEEELFLYLIHGILHLIGYKDGRAGERKVMEKMQQKILKSIL
ncbi:MAG: rRNA maturation RNase YbeY [Candidatus Omnitrophica bacterium]|nr:rRNA maturation RNase YbeY [Candidatus Omnitrophota bacterium]